MKNRARVIFMGSGEFGASILKRLAASDFSPMAVFTKSDKPVGRRQILSPSPAKKVAKDSGLKIFEPPSLKNDETEKLIKSLEPDLIIVADYGKIIPKNILEIPKFGALNVHPSLLPRHRGATPIQYTILSGDNETGVTIILMDEQIDHGPIVASEKLKIKSEKLTYTELLKESSALSGDVLLKTLPHWLAGEIKPAPQDETRATFTKILTKEDGKIDWQNPAEKIECQIRAFEDWPGTWSEWKSGDKKLRLKIIKAEILNPKIGCAENKTPGFVFLTEQREMAVNCNPGSLVIRELQSEGKNKTIGKEFLRGYPKIVGAILI
ncbi:methionyl-tRNA formyltransferase [Candidatus Falkowbacteria bacterium]|nr:methionyl-tRNA formyltransferase [Candidatus Falkowbacteria bacterium]